MPAGRTENRMPVAAIYVTIVADLVGSFALEDVIGVAELPNVTGADEIMAQGDVHGGRRIHGSVEDTKLSTNKQHSLSQQIGLLRHADVADFEIGAAVACTREHPLVIGGETGWVTNTLSNARIQFRICLILYLVTR